MLEILRCIFVQNLSKMGLLMFQWQHIFELTLTRNQPIQLNQSPQKFELCLEMIISTCVQNFSRIQCFILPWQHILWKVLLTNRVLKSVMTSLWRHFAIDLNKILYFCLLYQETSLCKIRAKSDKKQRSCKSGLVTLFLKIAQQFFVCEYFLLVPIDVPSFKLIEGQIKELQWVVPNPHPAENDQKSPGRIGLNWNNSANIQQKNSVLMSVLEYRNI